MPDLVDVAVWPVDQWETELPDDDRPLMVAYDLRDVLTRIERGIEHLGDGLALKADKTDLAVLEKRIGAVEVAAAKAVGWRGGFLVAAGLFGGLIAGLILNALEVV